MTGLKPVATKAKSEEEKQRLAPVKGAATWAKEPTKSQGEETADPAYRLVRDADEFGSDIRTPVESIGHPAVAIVGDVLPRSSAGRSMLRPTGEIQRSRRDASATNGNSNGKMAPVKGAATKAKELAGQRRTTKEKRLPAGRPPLHTREGGAARSLGVFGITIAPSCVWKEAGMRADRVDVSWDNDKANWVVRMAAGEEVIRRHCKMAKDADEAALRSAAQKTVQDEGYELDPASISIQR
jgi:hypothetical protein